MKRLLSSISLLALLCSCADPADTSEVEATHAELRGDTKGVVDHGTLLFANATPLTLEAGATSHRFLLSLSARATITLRTQADQTDAQVDTVLSLYRSAPKLKQPIASNDDQHPSRFSALTRTLPAGNYVVDVSGFKRTTRGSFELLASCEGQGCPVQASGCLLGSSFYELRTRQTPGISVGTETWVRDASVLDALGREQLVLAVQQASYENVVSAEDALTRVDQEEARWLELTHTASGRVYTAVEYGAGDNSYGAIFERGTTRIATSIHDGDLLDCQEH